MGNTDIVLASVNHVEDAAPCLWQRSRACGRQAEDRRVTFKPGLQRPQVVRKDATTSATLDSNTKAPDQKSAATKPKAKATPTTKTPRPEIDRHASTEPRFGGAEARKGEEKKLYS